VFVSFTLTVTGGWIVEYSHEWNREVDVGTGLFLDGLKNVALTPSDDQLKFVIDIANLQVETLLFTLAKVYDG